MKPSANLARTRRHERRPAATAADLRGANLERVLDVAMDHNGPLTRSELIAATGLSAPTVGSLVCELIEGELLRDVGTGPSRGGRRPVFMEFNARHGFVAALDLGPTKTRLAVGDLRGERLGYRVVPTPPGVGPEALLQRLVDELRALLGEANVPRSRLLCVAAGMPGAVDGEQGVVSLAPNLKGWADVPVAALLKRALGAPVIVENDVNLAVLGEQWRGAAQGHRTCVFITVGTGVGAGVVVDGLLHRGHHFLAGEIGLMCMGSQYLGQDFGTRGCLESLVGLKALAARTKSAERDTDRWVARLFEAAEAGEASARALVDDVAGLIGMAVANLCLVLDPSLVVLGGALLAQGEPLVREVRRIVSGVVPRCGEIVPSALDKEAPSWGALLVAMQAARARLRQELRASRGVV